MEDISRTIERALAAAGLKTDSGMPKSVMETIRGALASARRPGASASLPPDRSAHAEGDVIDIDARIVEEGRDDETARPTPGPAAQPRGTFRSFDYAGPKGRRLYKLYVPASRPSATSVPLLLMLHGCKQDPDDFARGTRMNEVAEELGFIVAYPAQAREANGSNCWRWFETGQQSRDGAEPSILAGIVREIVQDYPVDPQRVYVAGLSAGAAMAVILADTHPELFAAVGAHSGLPAGAAHDVPSAFAAMGGATAGAAPRTHPAGRAVPTIVFHGEADATVAPANGDAIVRSAVSRWSQRGPLSERVEQRECNGRRCRRTVHADESGVPMVEHWSVQGAGHAWFGGSRAGSYAVPEGPDASRELMRFFARHRNTRADAPVREDAS